ncbi:MAG: response regulator transcription factor [Acidimicrobiales bacterium]|nr:response regulator transcription factor [Acidimicrobiales bacterium]
MSLRILLADDHAILREGIRRSFESAGEEVVGEAANGEEALDLAIATKPDVIVMDLSMPVLDGIDATRRIKERIPDAKVVVLTMHDDVDSTRRAVSAGAAGFMSKGSSFADVLATVRGVAQGDIGFSPELAAAMLNVAKEPVVIDLDANEVETLLSDRQVEILQAIADGATTKQVARALNITQKTVHNHLNAIYRRLDTQSLTHAVLSAVRLGIIELD